MKYRSKGFSIVELLIGTVILTLVIGCAMAIYLLVVTGWSEGSVQITLQREASIAMEKMVRGVNGMNGIREGDANTANCPDANTIEYTGIDGVERSFSLDLTNGRIMYDPSTSNPNNEYAIAGNVRTTTPPGLRFSISGNIVTIDIGMQSSVISRTINVDLSTETRLRN